MAQALYKKKAASAPSKFDGIYFLTGLMRCPRCGATLVAHRVRDTLKDRTKASASTTYAVTSETRGAEFAIPTR